MKEWNLSRDDIDDLTQEGLIAALEADRTFNPEKGTKHSWVLLLVRQRLRKHIQVLRGGGMTDLPVGVLPLLSPVASSDDAEEDSELSFEPVDPGPSVEEIADQRQTLSCLKDRLSPKDWELLADYYGLEDRQQKTQQQIAAERGVSQAAVAQLIDRTLARARRALQGL